MNVNEVLNFRLERGNKRKILDVPQKDAKEKKKRDRPPKEEKPDEVDNFLKKILKKQEPGIQQPARPAVEKAEEKRAPQLTKETEMSEAEREKILAAVETHQEEETIDASYVKRTILAFEKKVTKNSEMRIKFPDHPVKFMESELDLHDELQRMHILATVPQYYPIIVKLNAVNTLLGLITHENTDISIAVVDLLQEMTDVENVSDDDEETDQLFDALLESQVVAVLVQNLDRLDESHKDEADGVHNSLAIIENLAEFRSETCGLAGEQGLIGWLLKRIKVKGFDANKLYTSEILAIMLQNNDGNRETVGDLNGVDILLQALAYYKRHDPTSSEEIEYMENLFNCLCSSLLHSGNKELFLKGEGLQLMILMLREKKMSRCSSLKVLDFAMTGPDGGDNCNKFIEILGLRSIFPLFMKPPKKNKKIGNGPDVAEEHTSSIIASLFRHSVGSSRSRLVQKFVENDHIKVDRLMELYFNYRSKVQDADMKIEKEKDELEEKGDVIDESLEDSFYLRRLDAGLFTLQLTVCVIMEACCSGVSSIKSRVMQVLTQHGGSPKDVKEIMREYASHVGDSDTNESAELEKRRLLSLVDRF
ncbi:beta-catenin-like protein 1 [Rhopilema esculentum]|uniref:beta-catenin-like protein 1 n=1 Tax=Rhopilema esculentum TaxID=499914 RepID=UPI0031DC9DEE